MGRWKIFHTSFKPAIEYSRGNEGRAMVSRYGQIQGEGGSSDEVAGDGPHITTLSGERYYFLHPDYEAFDIEDIANSLANTCRFGGHIKYHYSVAQHSIYVSDLLLDSECGNETALAGLMHDAHEAYLHDISSPLKGLLGGSYRQMCEMSQSAIEQWLFGKELQAKHERLVKYADVFALCMESKVLKDKMIESFPGEFEALGKWFLKPIESDIVFERMTPEEAKEAFLEQFRLFDRTFRGKPGGPDS